MAILQTCYCCSSLKQLSLAACIFTMTLSSIYVCDFFIEYPKGPFLFPPPGGKVNKTNIQDSEDSFPKERPFDFGIGQAHLDDSIVQSDYRGSVINPAGFSALGMYYLKSMKSICDTSVIVSCLLLLWALFKVSIELIIAASLIGLRTTKFEPNTAFIFTVDFLLIILHIYLILGVVSLFQENFRASSSPLIKHTVHQAAPPKRGRKQSAPPSVHVEEASPRDAASSHAVEAANVVGTARRSKSLIMRLNNYKVDDHQPMNNRRHGVPRLEVIHEVTNTGSGQHHQHTSHHVHHEEDETRPFLKVNGQLEEKGETCNNESSDYDHSESTNANSATESTALTGSNASSTHQNNNCKLQQQQHVLVQHFHSGDEIENHSSDSTHCSSNSHSEIKAELDYDEVKVIACDEGGVVQPRKKKIWPSAKVVLKALAGTNSLSDVNKSPINEDEIFEAIW